MSSSFTGPLKIRKSDGSKVTFVDADGQLVGDIKDSLAQGSIYIGNASGVSSELAIGASSYVLTSNGTTAAWAEGGVPSGTEVTATNDTEVGATLSYFHDSASPASDDVIAVSAYSANNSSDEKFAYCYSGVQLIEPTAGSEEAVYSIGVATADGGETPAFGDAQFQLGYDGLELTVPLGIISESDTAEGATLDLYQDSASPAAFDAVATFSGKGNSDSSNEVTYGNFAVGIFDPTDGAEEGAVAINVVTGGTLTEGGTSPFVITGASIKETVPTYLEQDEQALSGAGAVDVTSQITAWDCSGAVAGSLADGSSGQVKRIYCSAHTGDGTLTPTNLLGYSTITFTAAGQSVLLHFNGSNWVVDANNGATLGA